MTISDKFEIFIFDLHNTIYDEVSEYAQAIDAAMTEILKFTTVGRSQIYKELSTAHKKLDSDWDDDAWWQLPSLAGLDHTIIDRAIALRAEKSKAMTLYGLYAGVAETFNKLKLKGKKIYILSEAAADVGAQAVLWLGLMEVIDGIYTYPSRKKPLELKGKIQKCFAPSANGHLIKPNPLLIADVILDEAKARNIASKNASVAEFFATTQDKKLLLPELDEDLAIQEDISACLIVKNAEMQKLLESTIYVGDSKFKDGILARNAGVKFAWAAYGKSVKPGSEQQLARNQEILYAVTGWNKQTLKLTQEAAQSATVNALQPDYILHKITDLI